MGLSTCLKSFLYFLVVFKEELRKEGPKAKVFPLPLYQIIILTTDVI